jgi:hypothetical protein
MNPVFEDEYLLMGILYILPTIDIINLLLTCKSINKLVKLFYDKIMQKRSIDHVIKHHETITQYKINRTIWESATVAKVIKKMNKSDSKYSEDQLFIFLSSRRKILDYNNRHITYKKESHILAEYIARLCERTTMPYIGIQHKFLTWLEVCYIYVIHYKHYLVRGSYLFTVLDGCIEYGNIIELTYDMSEDCAIRDYVKTIENRANK